MTAHEPSAEPWVHQALEVRGSGVTGRGLFAREPIQAGEHVVRFGGRLVSHEQLVELLAGAKRSGRYLDTLQTGSDTHLVLPDGSTAHFGNHSCDPNAWLDGPFDLVARHDIAPNEEVTVDYGTLSILPDFTMGCGCAMPTCRGWVTGNDWRIETLQARYAHHWSPAALQLIESQHQQHGPTAAVEIRQRRPQDLDQLETLARCVHALDGYPPYLPDADFAGFLQSTDALAAWVAIVDDEPIGHVALHTRSSKEVMRLARKKLGGGPERIGVVSRLLVEPGHRRTGIAQQLLRTAKSGSLRLRRTPILDVVDRFAPAIALYERESWTRLGTVSVHLPDGTTIDEHVYVGPN